MDPTTDTATCREQETKSNSNREQGPINMVWAFVHLVVRMKAF
jgi:hypothetical protein